MKHFVAAWSLCLAFIAPNFADRIEASEACVQAIEHEGNYGWPSYWAFKNNCKYDVVVGYCLITNQKYIPPENDHERFDCREPNNGQRLLVDKTSLYGRILNDNVIWTGADSLSDAKANAISSITSKIKDLDRGRIMAPDGYTGPVEYYQGIEVIPNSYLRNMIASYLKRPLDYFKFRSGSVQELNVYSYSEITGYRSEIFFSWCMFDEFKRGKCFPAPYNEYKEQGSPIYARPKP